MKPDQAARTAGVPRPDLCVVGGGGHVGLPLALVFADKGLRVLIHDINAAVLETVRQGRMPFVEYGAEAVLKRVLAAGRLSFSTDPNDLAGIPTLIVTIGTPVDEFLNPDHKVFKQWVDANLPHLADDQLLILRSTVYPGTTDWLHHYLEAKGKRTLVAYCPERIVQGHAIEELQELPQLVSGTTPEAAVAAGELFKLMAPELVRLTPLEAEFAKLFANAYRYIQFATANQFYTITSAAGVDYQRVLEGMKKNYPRLADIPRAGFAAGPCLFKDTMQLAAFSQNQFTLGHAAMAVNEGLVLHLVKQLQTAHDLREMTVGLLGMAFKADIDDTRASLSYKLKKTLAIRAREILTTDPHVTSDPNLLPLAEVIDRSDILILCVPHGAYRDLDAKGKPVLDIWGFLECGKRLA